MSDSRLTIPDAASEAGERAVRLRDDWAGSYEFGVVDDVLQAAAPLICAHELRSVADELEWAQQELLEHRGFRSDGLAQALSHLRARANQRDGCVTRSGRDS